MVVDYNKSYVDRHKIIVDVYRTFVDEYRTAVDGQVVRGHQLGCDEDEFKTSVDELQGVVNEFKCIEHACNEVCKH